MITEWESHLLADPLPALQHNDPRISGPVQGVGIVRFNQSPIQGRREEEGRLSEWRGFAQMT